MEQNVFMRPLLQTDAGFLCSIFQDNEEYYHIFYDSANSIAEWENRVTRLLSQDVVKHFIIEAEGIPVGWLSYSVLSPDAWELDILVLKQEFLHRGYGSAALSWLIHQCTGSCASSITLNVNKENARAIHFYQKFGFRIVEEQIIPECNDAVNLIQYKMIREI